MSLRPHPRFPDLLRRIGRCAGEAGGWMGTVFRCTSPRYATTSDLLSGEGSRLHGVRWTPRDSFAAVYTSDTPETALAEVLNHYRYYGLHPSDSMPRTIVAVDVRLSLVVDLIDGLTRRRIGVSRRRMVEEDWRREQSAGRESLTQAIGRAAFASGLEAIFVPSAARRDARNLILFPANLRPASRMTILRTEEL